MIRVIVESQSSALWRGDPMEQSYDQRGGLCEVGAGNIVVTARPIDPAYLDYWTSLGFTLPKLIVARGNGEVNGDLTLSERLREDSSAQNEILSFVAGRPARLEFFWFERTEQQLANALPVPAYCNTAFSQRYTSKAAFRRLAEELGLPLAPGAVCQSLEDLRAFAAPCFKNRKRVIVKCERGSGGVDGHSALVLQHEREIDTVPQQLSTLGREFVAEEVLDGDCQELGVHWEITEDGRLTKVTILEQLARNYGYVGGCWPAEIPHRTAQQIRQRVRDVLAPTIRQEGGIGFFCCDVMIRPQQHWMDFNPRKGALRYICRVVTRLREHSAPFWHEQVKLRASPTFADVRRALGGLLNANRDLCVTVTNPGVIPYGKVDLTGIGPTRAAAHTVFEAARARLDDIGGLR